MQRKVSLLVFFVITLLSFVIPSSAQSNLSDDYDQLFLLLTLVSAAVLLLVVALWVYFVYTYRETNDVERKEISHETARKLEVGWTAVAIIIVIVLMALSFPILFGTTQAAEEDRTGELVIVEGTANWQWKYYLQNGSALAVENNATILNATVMDTSTSTLNRGDQVTNITLFTNTLYTFEFWNSANFIHSYFVYDLNIKMDVVPGINNTYTFEIDEPGSYAILCTEFCGSLHSQMKGFINAIPEGA